MGLFDPENDAEARVLATALIAALAAGAIPQEDWTHTINDADGSPTPRGLEIATRTSRRAYALAGVIVTEAERRIAALRSALDDAALADPLIDPLEMDEAGSAQAARDATGVPDIGDLLS